jgi:uncharacterized membrane protein
MGGLLLIAALLSVAGICIATYLTVVHFADQPIVCSSIGDCELVNSSRYASLAGVPVALLGAGAYVSMLALIAGVWLRRSPEMLLAAWGVALASFGFSIYLTYIELRVLDAICVYCVGSASIMTALFVVLSAGVWMEFGRDEEPQITQMSQI